jgi:hypothetical protein
LSLFLPLFFRCSRCLAFSAHACRARGTLRGRRDAGRALDPRILARTDCSSSHEEGDRPSQRR